MSSINPKKMKVAELKKELESRDIVVSKNMKKADLMALLLSTIESETGHENKFSSSEAPDDSAQSEPEGADSSIMDDEGEDQPQEEDQAQEEPSQDEGGREEESFLTANDETEPAQDIPEEVEPAKDELAEPQDETAELPQHEDEQDEVEQQSEEPPQPEIPEAELKQEEQAEEPMTENQTPQQDSVEDVPTNEETNQDPAPEETENPEQKEESTPQDIEMPEDAEAEKAESGEGEKTDEQKMTEENGDDKPENKDSKDDYHEYARKRRHDDRYDRHSRWEDKFAPPEEEPIEEFDDELVVLDIYNSDLNFKITRDRTGGQPLTMEGFAYLWGGARATYGVKSGKVCFECKILEEEAVKHLPSDEPHPRVVRVGWSTDKTGLQLGEEAFSYGYGGTGKSSADCKFNDFGETFHEGDVIGCYVNFEQEDKIEISYTKNGTYLGVAFTEEKETLEDALFPHVLCKNTSVEINFGQKESQFFDHPEELSDYTFIGSVPLEDRVRAQKAPEARKDCEVLMMCGLPGAGKTYFAKQKIKESPEKKYNILGTNAIMDKMKVMGVARKRNYAGRWELLIQNATQCLNRLFQIACRKRRNYILDQTNVYASAQRRKMRPFEGFQRKAIVIVPSDEEYKQRFEKRTQDEGKEVPEMAVLEMKANFSLPEEGNSFDEVIFTELDKQEAEKLVEKYREDGRKNGPPPEKRSRGGDRSRSHGGWRQRDNYGGGPPMSYGNRGGWGRYGGGGPMGYGRGGYGGPGGFRGGRGGGFGGRGGGGGYGNRGYDGGRDFNRRDGGRRDNRSGGGGGGGGKRGGWQQNRGGGYGGGRGGGGDMYGGYNKHNQGRGGGGYRNGGGGGAGGYQNRQGGGGGGGGQNKFQGNNNTHPSAQTYTYGHHPNQQQQQQSQQRQQPQQQQQQQQQQMQNYANYGMQGYNYQQPNAQQQQQGTNMQAQQQGYQQQYGQQDYSQQWAQYYQAQQNQQYQNYYANYQQYYNQQAAAAQQQQQQPAQK